MGRTAALVNTRVIEPLASQILKAIALEEQPAHHPGQAGDRRRLQPGRPEMAACELAARDIRRQAGSSRRDAVTREVDGGLQTVALTLPRGDCNHRHELEQPRYASLPNIMKAQEAITKIGRRYGVDNTQGSR